MFERYTKAARRVVFFARYDAGRRESPLISTPHFVMGLLCEGKSPFLDSIRLRKRLEEHWQSLPLSPDLKGKDYRTDLPLDDDAKKTLAYAAMEADRDFSRRIEPEHLLRGLLCFENVASQTLRSAGFDLEAVRNASNALTRPRRVWLRFRWYVLLILRESIWPAIWRVAALFLAAFLGILLLEWLRAW